MLYAGRCFCFARMNTIIFTTCGVVVLMLVVYDIYATILHARARSGPVGERLNRGVWRAARFIAFKLPRQRRHRFLNPFGPLLLPMLIIVLIIMLVLGFALIYLPRMPAHFAINPASASTGSLVEAIYFSGVTLTTVGYGDIAPRAVDVRFIALVESASGFALISLAVTYLITVYGALERKRAVALSFYHQAEEGANVGSFIAHHFVAGKFYGLDATLRAASRDLQELLESHIEHPVIHYFHPVEVYKSLPRVLFLALETCVVIRSCLDPEEYAAMHDHPEVRTLEATVRHVLDELVRSLRLERRTRRRTETKFDESKRWRERYRQTLRQLKSAGIKTRVDVDAGLEEYGGRREDWEAQLHRFATYLGYDWDEVTGDAGLQYAADEEMETPHVETAL